MATAKINIFYPLCGCTAIPRGSNKPVLNKTFLTLVWRLATSIVSLRESVQNMFLETQSILIPSGEIISTKNAIKHTQNNNIINCQS